jgi:SAM-dependent methyltransferase
MRYPQSLFTEKIKNCIPNGIKSIIDAPCGNGETTYELAQYFSNTQWKGIDISKENISRAKKNYSLPNLTFEKADIHKFVENSEKFEVFCLINSLFLLPNPKELIQKIANKLIPNGQLIIILPNSESTNFKRYQSLFPKVNNFILKRMEYKTFFENLGLIILSCDGIVRVPIYGRWDTKVLFPIRDRYLFHLESRSKSEDFGYYLLVLNKVTS